jgi:hypothetical protein
MSDTPTSGHEPTEPIQPTQPEPTQPPAGPGDHLTPPAGAAPTAEQPRAAAVPTTPVASTTAVDEPPRRRGVMVPFWALAVVAALVVFGGGYLIGHAVADDGAGNTSARFARPGGNPGFGPFSGNGGGRIPNPFGGNGNGNGFGPFGGNGNGNGGDRPTERSQAFLGVGVANAANHGGARITTVVSAGPASDAGLTRGDVITAIGSTKVTNVATLRSAIADHQPGDHVKVSYTRDGTDKTVDATLGDRNATTQ